LLHRHPFDFLHTCSPTCKSLSYQTPPLGASNPVRSHLFGTPALLRRVVTLWKETVHTTMNVIEDALQASSRHRENVGMRRRVRIITMHGTGT